RRVGSKSRAPSASIPTSITRTGNGYLQDRFLPRVATFGLVARCLGGSTFSLTCLMRGGCAAIRPPRLRYSGNALGKPRSKRRPRQGLGRGHLLPGGVACRAVDRGILGA